MTRDVIQPLTPEESGQVILGLFRSNGVRAGESMPFPAISARFMQADSRGSDLSAGLAHLLERGYLEQGPQNRTAYFLTDAGSAAPGLAAPGGE